MGLGFIRESIWSEPDDPFSATGFDGHDHRLLGTEDFDGLGQPHAGIVRWTIRRSYTCYVNDFPVQ
jgi:hypothetical protein